MDGAEKWRGEQDSLVDWTKRVRSKRVRVGPTVTGLYDDLTSCDRKTGRNKMGAITLSSDLGALGQWWNQRVPRKGTCCYFLHKKAATEGQSPVASSRGPL